VIKSKISKYAEHAAGLGKIGGTYRVLVEPLRERDQLGDPYVDEIIIFRWIFM
jgi:hypothetical protein